MILIIIIMMTITIIIVYRPCSSSRYQQKVQILSTVFILLEISHTGEDLVLKMHYNRKTTLPTLNFPFLLSLLKLPQSSLSMIALTSNMTTDVTLQLTPLLQ
jgi:hypothetical protein